MSDPNNNNGAGPSQPSLRDIAEPVAISPTIQEFRGERYWFRPTRRTFVRQLRGQKARLLSHAVYSAAHGDIPVGWHIHHIDRDRTNNALSNLEALSPEDHAAEHRDEQRTQGLLNGPQLDRGRRKPRPQELFTCTECGTEYLARRAHGLKTNRCCSHACHMRVYRRRKNNV
jgi:hypothetical protein